MKYKILISEIIFVLTFYSSFGQNWIRIYSDSVNLIPSKVWEHYDKGYMFTGQKYKGWSYYGWIMKTNINGYAIWSKTYGNQLKMNQFVSSRITNDGGVILCGSTNLLSTNCTDPLIVKVNPCGEKKWCKIYNAPGCDSWAKDVEVIAENGYLALITQWKSEEEERIWLFRLDSVGEVIWAQAYATDTAFWSEVPNSLVKTNDSCYIITGQAYYPDPTYPTKKIIKIILIKVNLDGDAIFEVPWGASNGVYSDGRLSVIDSKNNIYTAGRRARTEVPYGDSPSLFKTSKTGNPVFYKDLKSNPTLGIATTINWFQDSTFGIVAQWKDSSGLDTTGVIKTDSLGNFKKQKNLTTVSEYAFWGSDITFNDRLILGGSFYDSGYFHGYAIKLTSGLEYDSIYTTPFTYDSLCSYPIVSDTIPLNDCEVVIVGIDDPLKHPEKTMLHVFPNPAQNIITIEMPQYLNRQSKGNGITAITTYHQWKSATLEIYDLFGKLMLTREVPSQTKSLNIDISQWSAGMYVARLVFMNDVVASAKFVVVK